MHAFFWVNCLFLYVCLSFVCFSACMCICKLCVPLCINMNCMFLCIYVCTHVYVNCVFCLVCKPSHSACEFACVYKGTRFSSVCAKWLPFNVWVKCVFLYKPLVYVQLYFYMCGNCHCMCLYVVVNCVFSASTCILAIRSLLNVCIKSVGSLYIQLTESLQRTSFEFWRGTVYHIFPEHVHFHIKGENSLCCPRHYKYPFLNSLLCSMLKTNRSFCTWSL